MSRGWWRVLRRRVVLEPPDGYGRGQGKGMRRVEHHGEHRIREGRVRHRRQDRGPERLVQVSRAVVLRSRAKRCVSRCQVGAW